jgi:dolichol kinase
MAMLTAIAVLAVLALAIVAAGAGPAHTGLKAPSADNITVPFGAGGASTRRK